MQLFLPGQQLLQAVGGLGTILACRRLFWPADATTDGSLVSDSVLDGQSVSEMSLIECCQFCFAILSVLQQNPLSNQSYDMMNHRSLRFVRRESCPNASVGTGVQPLSSEGKCNLRPNAANFPRTPHRPELLLYTSKTGSDWGFIGTSISNNYFKIKAIIVG